MRNAIVLALAAVTATLAAPALAAEAAPATVEVSIADLDLAAPAGNEALTQRIDAAVDEVCAKPHIRDLKAMLAWEECKTAARAGALEQISVLEPFESIELASNF